MFINGFEVLEILPSQIISGKKRKLCRAICPVCKNEFIDRFEKIKRPGQLSCSRKCKNDLWASRLKESNGFKIISTGEVINSKRIVYAECPYCLKPFKSTIQSLTRTTQCGCLNFIPKNINPRLARIRNNMIQRCHNPRSTSYCRYGERGISVCEEWRKPNTSFFDWALSNGYSDDLSIDRINNDGNYEPDNCRWATRKEQMSNTRKRKKKIPCI